MSSALDELFDLLEKAGCEITLNGKPASRAEIERVALAGALERLAPYCDEDIASALRRAGEEG